VGGLRRRPHSVAENGSKVEVKCESAVAFKCCLMFVPLFRMCVRFLWIPPTPPPPSQPRRPQVGVPGGGRVRDG